MNPANLAKNNRPWYYYLIHNSIVEPPLYKNDETLKNKPFFKIKTNNNKIYCTY